MWTFNEHHKTKWGGNGLYCVKLRYENMLNSSMTCLLIGQPPHPADFVFISSWDDLTCFK